MTEWRFWEGDEPPAFTMPEFFRTHPRIDPGDQVGHLERTVMSVEMTVDLIRREGPGARWRSLLDLGCGDGSYLAALSSHSTVDEWELAGTDAGEQNIAHALSLGLAVIQDDFTQWSPADIQAGVVVLNEVLEHLVDPHGLLASVDADLLVCTSPLAEDADWHYEHHAWAWDRRGYEEMVQDAGWELVNYAQAAGDRTVVFPPLGLSRVPVFQCLTARRA